MPAGSGSRPSSASSGAVEAECQHETEADDVDGYADEDGIDDIDDIDDIDEETDASDAPVESDGGEESDEQALEHSYSRIMETLQKVNELEKKHSVELAEANAKLEKEVTVREQAEKEIRRLSRKLIDGTEEAQKNLAQDLHDEFGQTLTAFHLGLEKLNSAIPKELTRQKEQIMHLIPVVEQLGEKIRSISSNLRPDLLDDLGLVPTLDWYVKEFQDVRKEPVIDFQSVGLKKRLPPDIELVLYRIFQESINNVVKHSEARNVYVMLTYNYPKVILMVKDDGKGFEPDGRFSGIGLIGMRERAESMTGTLDIRSEKGKGTSIRTELPVNDGFPEK